MTAKYFAILTNQGAARLANAAALGTKLNLTQMAVGDANGTLPTPDPSQTKLINQKRIAPLNLLTVDPGNTSQIIAEQIIPENEGGFWIREIGLYDDDGILIAVANCPETYKPQLQEGSGRTQTIRMILIVSSTSAITLKIDPAVVLATRQYVDDKIIEVKGYADDLMKKHVEAANPHKQYPLIANALKEMVDAGLAGDVLKNLGLGDASGYVGRWVNTRVFTSSDTYTPTPGTKRIRVTITGGGGGGGGCQAHSSNETFFGGGGGAGGTIISTMTPTQNSYPVTIGAGGAGGVSATNGLKGGDSVFASLIAPGGQGGGKMGATNTNGGEGGAPNTGDIRINGGYGGDGQSGNIGVSGEGGASYWGGGGRAGAGGGVSGNAYGSGGGGAYDPGYSGTSMTGGKGAAGICIIEEFA